MSTLDSYINKYSKFLMLDDGESFEGIYESCKESENSFNPEQASMSYFFIVGDYKKQFKTGSIKFARAMNNVEPGTKVKITRHGQLMKTNYDVQVI